MPKKTSKIRQSAKGEECQEWRDIPGYKGSKHANSKLTEEQVREIKQRLGEGETSISIAKDYPVSHGCIRTIKCGGSWNHV